jgi:hypothetical protein
MGGQACVFYGAAEFSRDADFAILASPENLGRLGAALAALQAQVIAVPPFDISFLERGHAVHFRCGAAADFRVDVMAKLRGVDPFPALWARRTTLSVPDEEFETDLLSLPDLVKSKKTQRDKDWPMIRRLVDASYARDVTAPRPEQVRFWLSELRTPEYLVEAAQSFGDQAKHMEQTRPVLGSAIAGDLAAVRAGLAEEEQREREADRAYWIPLKAELEQMRHGRFTQS